MNCKNCGKEIKEKKNDLFPKDAVDIINLFTKSDKEEYCVACGKNSYKEAVKWRDARKNEIYLLLVDVVNDLPNLNSVAPINWEYDVIGVVVSRIVTPQFIFQNDENVIKNSINGCIENLYVQSLNKGGNLVMNIDLDFLEINKAGGLDKTIVTATGTSIKINNTSILLPKQQNALKISAGYMDELKILSLSKNYNL